MTSRKVLKQIALLGSILLWGGEAESPADTALYVGYGKCRTCHLEQFNSWERSAHATAMESLPRDQRREGRCLVCHSTGFGEAAAQGRVFEQVQCEACHGPGSLYKSPTIMSKGEYRANPQRQEDLAREAGLSPMGEQTCRPCHGGTLPEGHPVPRPFDYRTALQKIRHRQR
jgi:hypothetical protein